MKRLAFFLVPTVVTAAALLPFFGSDYLVGFFFNIFLFVTMACGWNLISGYTAYISFGQISFFGVGAYTMAILVTRLGWPWPAAVLAGGAVGMALSVPFGWVMLRLRGPYFALGMLGLMEVLRTIASAWSDLTGGGGGIYLPPEASLRPLYFSAMAMVIAGICTTWLVDRSAFGLRLQSIREDEVASEAMGVDTTRNKLAAFVVASVFPAMAGGLYAWRLSYIDPQSAFPVHYELLTILMTIFGGAGTVWGPLVGGFILSGISEVLWAKFAELHLLLFGVLIILVLMFMPSGLVPLFRRLGAKTGALAEGAGKGTL